MSDNRRNQDSNTKLEIANKIASQRQKSQELQKVLKIHF